MKTILLSIAVLGVLGAIFGALLAVAAKIFHVEVDPRQAAVREALAGANCGGCGACVDACPKSIVKLIPEKQKIMPACRNEDKGAAVMKMCKVGCIGCMKCQRECPADAIHVVNNLAQVDTSKCVQCGHCADICPRHIINYFGKSYFVVPPKEEAAQ